MYICEECGEVLEQEELTSWTEDTGEGFCGCPKCHGSVEEATECDYCNDYVPTTKINYLKKSQCCDYCYKETMEAFQRKLKEQLGEFMEGNRDILEDYYELNGFEF